MGKKKAIKIATASALVASTFAAVAPTQADAASVTKAQVKKAVDSAVSKSKAAYTSYASSKLTSATKASTVQSKIKSANSAISAAEKKLKSYKGSKTSFNKQIKTAKTYVSRANQYVKAYNAANYDWAGVIEKALDGDLSSLKKVGTAKANYTSVRRLNNLYSDFNSQVKSANTQISKVYGKTARGLLTKKFIDPANKQLTNFKDVSDAAKYVEKAETELEKSAKTRDLDKVAEYLTQAAKYLDNVSDSVALKELVANYYDNVNSDYEALAYPAVESVTAIDETTVQVQLKTAKADLTAKNFKVEVNGTEVTPSAVKASDDNKTYTLTVASLDGKEGTVSVNGVKASFDYANAKVVSVSAINASQIVVKFNKAVDKATAESTTNYVLTKADGTTISVTSAKVKEDGKSVLLTVTPITTKTTFTLTVKNVKLDGSLTEEFPLYSQVLTVEDKVNPEIADVVSKTNSDVATSVTAYFTEPVTAGAIKIDGVTKSYSLAADGMSATISGLSLDANKSHTLEIVNLTDTANNVNTLVSKTFNVTKDTAAPMFTVSTESDNKIVLTFDKAVDDNTINTTNIVLKDEKLDTVGGYSVSVPAGYDNKRVEITLPAGTYSSKDSRTFTIMASDEVKDYLGNKLVPTTKTVTINEDVTAPKLTDITYVKDSTGKVTSVLFKYDEKVETANLGLTATDAVTGASVDLFGTLTVSDVDVLSDGKTVKVDVKGSADVKSGKLEISVPANFVKDTALTPNNSAAVKKVVDFGADAASELKVQSVTTPGRNQYKVTFSDVVTYASATNPANYTINGVALPEDTTIAFDTTNKNNVTITLPNGFITEDDTGSVLRVQNVETAAGTKVSANTNVITVDDNAGPVIVKEKSAINSNGTLSIGFNEPVIAANLSVLNDLVFTVNGSTVTVGNGNVTVVDGTGSDAGKYVVTFNTDVTSTPDANGKYYEYFDIDGDDTLDATDIIVQTSTSALTPGVFNLNNVSSLKVGTVATPSVITDTNTYSGAPAANTIVEKQSVVIK